MTSDGLTDTEFRGYTFTAAPPNLPRLWFRQRDLYPLFVYGQRTLADIPGRWTIQIRRLAPHVPASFVERLAMFEAALPGTVLRYDPFGAGAILVWQLTDTVIDTPYDHDGERRWRLGVWPD